MQYPSYGHSKKNISMLLAIFIFSGVIFDQADFLLPTSTSLIIIVAQRIDKKIVDR